MRDIPGQVGPMADWPRVEAMPGARRALRALSVLPVLCVATNATDSDAVRVAEALERVGLRTHLTHFFTSQELGARKPDPRFFENVALRLGIPPENLMAVGNDLRKDIGPAKRAGMNTVLVAHGQVPRSLENVDLVLPTLGDLADLFLRWVGEDFPPG